jgi:serine/threonine protein kinase
VKSTNILLDDACRPLVADMGLCRVLAPAATHTTTRRMGTDGYIDPEYSETLELREQSDVYSFGVVLLELISNQAAYTDGMNPPVRSAVCVGSAGGRARHATRAAGRPAGMCIRLRGTAASVCCADALRARRRGWWAASGSTCARRAPSSPSRTRPSASRRGCWKTSRRRGARGPFRRRPRARATAHLAYSHQLPECGLTHA